MGFERVRATVAYDGDGYHGFALNEGVRTVAGDLTDAVSMVSRHAVKLVCAGRTDAGVHARGQVVSFDLPQGVDLARLQRSVNKLLQPRIALRQIAVAPAGFSARFDAHWRRYRYRILNAPTVDPLSASISWHVPHALDLTLMRLACDPLIGEHDFSSFCRRPKGDPAASMTRRVLSARWLPPDDDLLCFEICASAFCHQMVRSIVGFMVDVGRGRRRAGELTGVLRAGDRAAAGTVAPGHGLCLEEVGYQPLAPGS